MKANLTQEQVAEALGVSRQTVSNWENEKTYPDIVSVVKMSDLYHISLDHLSGCEKSFEVSWMLLEENVVNNVVINEKDPLLYHFWKTVFENTHSLVKK